jgi:hypothetical protein
LKNLTKKLSLVFGLLAATSVSAHSNHASHTHFDEFALIVSGLLVSAYILYRLISAHKSLMIDNHKIFEK